ncbi:MAG TPA: molybdenum cofactor guanylyltransferase [Devosia sp.]|jgi:molybdopterin-guanine dinucleotide biosynthesis protein A|nr:molybdenum cofactor guanylyltransferase [Devosia sp.]
MNCPHAVILAGGKGERLGDVRKATLRVGGVRLVDRVTATLGATQSPLLIATGPGGADMELPAGAVAVADLTGPVGGPLAGLAAAIAWLHAQDHREGLLVSAAVDTPFLPPDFVAQMIDALGDADAACAAWRDQPYPPNAVWRIDALTALPEQVRQGKAAHSLKVLQQAIRTRSVDWAGRTSTDPFANVNTVGDLVALGRLA